jgi:hypothetical protein
MVMLVLVLAAAGVCAQTRDTVRVSVRANVKPDMIQLRWAVNTPGAWKQSTRAGFHVERYTVVRNGVMLNPAERVELTPGPLLPQPLNAWQTLATKNNYAAIIAQALYGQDFQLSSGDSKGVSKFIAMAQELEQRYLVSTYAADLCYPAALLAGWGFEDRTVKPGERYLYRVIPVVPPKGVAITQGSVYVSVQDYEPLPQPQELTAIFGDKTVMLTWNYKLLGHLYNAYYIEKSADGKTFTRISETPFTNMNGKGGMPTERMYYMDTLTNNAVTTHYRVVGISSFGEDGPPSDIVRGKGKGRLVYVPHIHKAIPTAAGGVDIGWEFDERGNALVRSFELHRGNTDQGPFTPVLKNIPPTARTLTYPMLQSSNYFVIVAMPPEGDPTVSFPVLVQPSDTMPPVAPVGLRGVVDSLGVVQLTWAANTEPDLLGYRIYRGQTTGEELIPLNDVAVRTNRYTDTLDVHNLNSQVFYAVTAVDQRYNQSPQSSTVQLEKPELVPPSPPVITHYTTSPKGITLKWVTGGEENIGALRLYRQERGQDNALLREFTNIQATEFTDSTTQGSRHYAYTLICVTRKGLASLPSRVVTVQAPVHTAASGKFSAFEARVNRREGSVALEWKHDLADVRSYELYKGEGDKQASLWKTVRGFEQGVKDTDVKPGTSYQYMIRAVLATGKTGATATVKVR